MKSRLVVGQVLSSHGVRGEVNVRSLSGEHDHIRSLKRACLSIAGRETEHDLITVRGRGKNLIVLFDGITSPEEAKSYRSAEIIVHRDQALQLEDGEYYVADLVHCKVLFEDEPRGHVRSVWGNGQCEMLEVERLDGQIVQLPLQDHFIAQVDVHSKIIQLKVAWVLE